MRSSVAGTRRGAYVVYANDAAIRPGSRVGPYRVRSRMLLWSRQGAGVVNVNGRPFRLTKGRFLMVPWDHQIDYTNDGPRDWVLAGIHIIPDLSRGGPQTYDLPHDPSAASDPHPERHDMPLAGLESVVAGDFRITGALSLLADYTVAWFRRGLPDDGGSRALAGLLIAELLHAIQDPQLGPEALAPPLRSAVAYAREHLHRAIRIAELARAARVSPATLGRLFRSQLKTSPSLWLRMARMEKAETLLRSTGMRVAEVGRAVGFEDPYHFSRSFKRVRGVNASALRRPEALL